MKKVLSKINKKLGNISLVNTVKVLACNFIEAIIILVNLIFLFLELIVTILLLVVRKITKLLLSLQQKNKEIWKKKNL